MRFIKQAGVAAALASAATALVIKTDVDVVYATELVYVDPAGKTLSEVPAYTPPAPAPVASSKPHKHHTSPSSVPIAYTTSAYIPPPQPTTTTTTTSVQLATTTQQPTTLQTYTTTTAAGPSPYPSSPSSGGCADPASIYAAAADLCEGASDHAYCQAAVGAHNLHRSNHSAAPIKWDSRLEGWAKQHVDQCVFQDYLLDEGVYHQSNAWAGTGDHGDGEAAAHSWYNTEQCLYNNHNLYGNPSPPAKVPDSTGQDQEVGHFANVVWKGWTSMACATKLCGEVAGMRNANFTLCFYSEYDLAHQDPSVNVARPNNCPVYPANYFS
ncbi:PR-1-like protein [Myriangium duriaei CBS 260.36]|uniref:PR-1-like protein n=1 Tax=Myriangium duriaei CBS 260.36 TaxID=1168546 RepID=A0A9P4MJ71_9PEZI|nr:PR-1-like protein [Myriangium duriaei CBS 260.36]